MPHVTSHFQSALTATSSKLQKVVLALVVIATIFCAVQPCQAGKVKHVILMISDGAGYNTWLAAAMYQGRYDPNTGQLRQVFTQPGWIILSCKTNSAATPAHGSSATDQPQKAGYESEAAWDPNTGYQWLKSKPTDSAAAATAMATGQKTLNGRINWSVDDKPIHPTLPEIARGEGMSVGIVTSVQWSHATPAALGGAHVPSRNQYAEIAEQLLRSSLLDVIMGAGHPEFDDDGAPAEPTEKKLAYVGGPALWEAIKVAWLIPGGTIFGYRPVMSRAEFERLTIDPTPPRVLGIAQVASTLQQKRKRVSQTSEPYTDPLVPNVPTLATMTKAALNVLDNNPRGFLLVIEGGAVDWACHANQADRMIEEQIDFQKAVEAVVEWVEKNSNWEETLLVITADHETGLVWGPESDKKPFQPLEDRGIGNLPGLRFNSGEHVNSLVPLFIRGAGAEKISWFICGNDIVRGPYVDNTAIFQLLQTAITAKDTSSLASEKPACRRLYTTSMRSNQVFACFLQPFGVEKSAILRSALEPANLALQQ